MKSRKFMGIALSKDYAVFSLVVGIVSVLAGVALVRLGINGFASVTLIPLTISVATARRYSQWRKLLGPVIVASALFTLFAVVASLVALIEFRSSLGISLGAIIGLSVIGAPFFFAVYLFLLFIPSFVFFSLEKRCYGSMKRFFVRNKANLLPSLLIGVPGFLVGLGVSIAVKEIPGALFGVLSTALVISSLSAIFYSRFGMLKGPVVAASLAVTAGYAILAFNYGESPFGVVGSFGESLRLLMLELPSLFIVSFLVLFAVSGIFYAALKPVFKPLGRKVRK